MKKKIFALAFSFLLALGLSATFAGCMPQLDDSKLVTVTVDYNNADDTFEGIQIKFAVEKGVSLIDLQPNTFTPSKYLEFDYWCTDSELTQKFNLNNDIVSDTTLYAKWKVHEDYNYTHVSGPSMSASGINAGDYIIYKYLTNEDTIELNDIVLVYLNSQLTPRCISQIIDNGNGTYSYKTKGSSNATEDKGTSTREDLVGIYQENLDNPEQYLKYIGSI